MTSPTRSNRSSWAPWWAYLVPILAVNYVRQALVAPDEAGDVVSIALFAATTAVVAAVVTALHRRTAPS